MGYDIFLVIGVVVGVFSIPSFISALSDKRAPSTLAIMVLISGGLLAIAVSQKPGGYTIQSVPDVFVRVVGKYIL